MTPASSEQRNPYKGSPHARGWVRVTLAAPDGTTREVELIADTGSPFDVLIDDAALLQFGVRYAPPVRASFGMLGTAWVRLVISDIGFDEEIPGFSNDGVVLDAQADDPNFAGLLGLPTLRKMQYGGDADWFWIRPAAAAP